MNNDIEIVDKWAVIVGTSRNSPIVGDPSLHLHRIYNYEDKQYALNDLKYLKDIYKVVFIQQIKCDKEMK